MFTAINALCGFEHHVVGLDGTLDYKDSRPKWNLIAALCADIIAGLALLVVGGLVTANIIPLSPVVANAMLAIGGALLGACTIGPLILMSMGYGSNNPSFNPNLLPPQRT